MASISSAFAPKRLKAYAALAIAAASIVALSACSGSNSSSTTTDSSGVKTAPGNATSGTVSFWAGQTLVNGQDMNKVLIDNFEQKYPNIKVNYTVAPSDTDTNRATLTTQISGGGGPDVYEGDVIWPAQFAAHQLAVPLSDYLPQSYWNTFANGLVAGATYKGKVYAAPYFADQGFLYYRKDILKEDGLSVPKTWDQLVSDSKVAQSKGQVKYGYVFQGADYEGATCNFMEFLTDAGGKVLNSDGTKSLLNSAATLKTLTFMKSLVSSGVSPAATSTYQEAQALNDFQAGKALFLRNWDYAYASANAPGLATTGNVGVAPMPSFSADTFPGYSNIGGWNFYVNPHSKNIAADLTFIKFMTNDDSQKIIATQFSEIPTVQAVRTNPDVIAASPTLATAPKTRLVARPANTPNYPAVSQAIYNAVNGVLAGSLTPEAAVKQMDSGVNNAVSASGGL